MNNYYDSFDCEICVEELYDIDSLLEDLTDEDLEWEGFE